MNRLIQDVRYAIRIFRRHPGFTLAAVLSLALGIGANTAIFSVAHALLLQPLAYRHSDRLAILWNRSPGLGITEDWFSTAQYFDIKTSHRGLEEVAIAIGGNYNLTGEGEPERIGTIRVSSNLLPMLGVAPELGRLFTTEDDAPGTPSTVILGHGTWLRRYGGDSNVIGRRLYLNGDAYEIVGVLPAGFSLPREVLPTLGGAEDSEVVIPLPLGPDAPTIRIREDYNILGRLRPDVTVAQAQSEMDALTARLTREHPDFYPPNGNLTFSIVPLQEQVVGSVRQSVLVLMAAVGCVLLIACANVANLWLARAVARQNEIATRVALGASRRRLVRQLLTESVLLALAGGAVGIGLAAIAVRGIRTLGTASVPRLHEIAIDVPVLLFTLAVSIAAGVLFGLVPALRLGRLDVHGSLKDASRGSAGASAMWGRGNNSRRLLVALELALSVALLVAAGLLIRSFARLQDVSPGFNPSGTLTLELTMAGRRYSDPAFAIETYRQLWERLGRLPGVTAVGGVSALPLSQMFAWGPVTIEGRPLQAGEAFINVDMRMVAGDYFKAMEIPLVAGRLFDSRDRSDSQRVVIVDEFMAKELWPGVDAVGKRLRTGGRDATTPWLTVVGVIGRVKQYTLDADSRIAMYFPHPQYPVRAMNIVLRTQADPASLAAGVRNEIRAVDSELPLYGVRTMDDRIDASLAQRRFSMLILSLLAALALGLAAVGIYGVMAYLVSQGTREIGIRMALGATPRGLVMMVVRQGMAVALVGVAAGLVAALLLTRLMRTLLFGVDAADPLTFAAVPAVLVLVALAACYVPGRRAARVDPVVSLRSD